MQIAQWNPKVLVEVHGHSGKKTENNIEISSGSSANDVHSKKLATSLIEKLSKNTKLKDLSICGEYKNIYFKASTSVTIGHRRWIAFHIELPPNIRKPSNGKSGKPNELSYQFCDCLVDALIEMFRQ